MTPAIASERGALESRCDQRIRGFIGAVTESPGYRILGLAPTATFLMTPAIAIERGVPENRCDQRVHGFVGTVTESPGAT